MFLNKLILISFLSFIGTNQPDKSANFDAFSKKFVAGYTALHIPDLALSYTENLKNIKSANDVTHQITFFQGIKQELKQFELLRLSPAETQDFKLISYETGLNLERLKLEKNWLSRPN